MIRSDESSLSTANESSLRRFRVIVLTHGGAEDVIRQLMHRNVEIAGIFVEMDIVRHYGTVEKLKRSVRYDGYSATVGKIIKKILGVKETDRSLIESEESRAQLERLATDNHIPFHVVDNYHSSETIALLRSTNADLGVIYGTNIIRETVFSLPRLGSINLHQGLAPYYRGGPPIFWELYNGESEVGLTVHYVATKVDSGDIILQQTAPLKYDYSYDLDFDSFITDFCNQLRPRCAQMVADAVKSIADGTAKSKRQDSTIGKRYRLPLKSQKNELRRLLRERQQQPADAWKRSQQEAG